MKRYLPCVLGLAATLALGSIPALAQDEAAKQPAELSSNLLMDDELAPAPASNFKIDPALLAIPENASADELFEFFESLQEKLPQPASQEELYKLVDAYSQTGIEVANKLLAMENLTPKQRERAIQLKVVTLTTRANVDKSAADELNKFVDENIANAKSTDELVKAYQLKLQVLASSEEDPLAKIDELANEALALEQEELQLFAIEVKANSFITGVQKNGVFDEGILKFVQSILDDAKRSAKVKEKALEMKLVAFIVGSELENEAANAANDEAADATKAKEDKPAEEKKSVYADQAEALFTEILDGEYSIDLKKSVYQLRVQTLLQSENQDQEKINAVIEKLLAQEDEELYALGVAVKGQTLLNAASKDKAAVPALAEYAKKVCEEAKTKSALKSQSVGLMVQTYRLQDDMNGLLEYVDAELAANPDETLRPNLENVKVSVVSALVAKDPKAFDQHKDFIDSLKGNEQYAAAAANIYMTRFRATLDQVAENGSDMNQFNAAIEQFKADLSACPRAITGLLMCRESIDAIGKANNNEELFDKTFDQIIDFCKASDVEELNTLAQNLEVYLAQMRQAQQAQAEQAAKQAEEKAAAEKTSAEEIAPAEKNAAPANKADAKAAPAKKADAKAAPAKKADAKVAPAKKAAAKAPAKNAKK